MSSVSGHNTLLSSAGWEKGHHRTYLSQTQASPTSFCSLGFLQHRGVVTLGGERVKCPTQALDRTTCKL
jgi:hypothetical protein